MRIRAFLLLSVALLPEVVGADFRIEGGANDDFLLTVGIVAVLPASCPAEIDCVWLDRKVAGELLRRRKPEFRSAAATEAALTALGAKELTGDNRTPLAASLGAQTLLEIRVREVKKVRAGGRPNPDERRPEANERYARGDGDVGNGDSVRGRLEIRAISAETGRTVAEGAAFGDAPGLAEKKLLGPMVAQLLDRMFPLPRK